MSRTLNNMKKCNIDDCNNVVLAKNLCRYHYFRLPVRKLWQDNNYKKNRDKLIETAKTNYIERKNILWNQILDHYGRKCNCSGCPETKAEFLTLDHKNGGGCKHRRELKGSLYVYKSVIFEGFPDTYQLLCMNCNWATRHVKKCPHINVDNS